MVLNGSEFGEPIFKRFSNRFLKKTAKTNVQKKQIVHNTDTCSLLSLGFQDVKTKKQNCYRRHQDFKKKLQSAINSDNSEIRRFARKCLWQMIERKPTKYLNQQLKAIKDPIDDELLFKKFRNFNKLAVRKEKKPMVVLVQ